MKNYVLEALGGILLVPSLCFGKPVLPVNNNSNNSISFVENKGQIVDQYNNRRNDIQYKVCFPGLSVFIGDGQLHYQWSKTNQLKTSVAYYRVDVSLIGADPSAETVVEQKPNDYEMYNVPGLHDITVNSFGRITYKNIYPNIDWVLYSKDGHLKYDFIVHNGGDTRKIQLKFDGATNMKLMNGSFVFESSLGSITEEQPYTYKQLTGERINSAFRLVNNVLSFDISNAFTPLVIDPTIDWSTYYGGSNAENSPGNGVACDKDGFVYITGQTQSSNLATTGAYQTTIAGGYDAYIAKFNGYSQRIWTTYFGGYADEMPYGIACDQNGNVCLIGTTKSSTTSIATTGAHQTTFGGGASDAFLAKFTSQGQLSWATYYGGSKADDGLAVACDTGGNIYIGGSTLSTNSIATAGAFKTILSGNLGDYDGFLVKFNASGVRQWATYYGGTSADNILAICWDKSNYVYATGGASSLTNMSTAGTFQQASGGNGDAFIVQFDALGTRQWATYMGGTSGDEGEAIATDNVGYIYITGETNSTDAIASPGASQTTAQGNGDVFLEKFNNVGQRVWGTYGVGGSKYDMGISMAIDFNNSVYISGYTTSTNLTTTPGCYQSNFTGGVSTSDENAFFAKYSPSGQVLYSSYFGGSGSYVQRALVACDKSGNLYLEGMTASSSGVSTSNGFQPTYQGNQDGFLARFVPDTIMTITPLSTTTFCPGATFNLSYTANKNFQSSNVFTAQLSDANGSFSSPVNIGTSTSNTSGAISCTIPTSTPTGTGYRIRIISTAPFYISNDNNANVTIQYNTTSVSISASPGTTVPFNSNVSFSSAIVNGGSSPTYQWRLNGTDIPGATNSSYNTTTLANNDVISLLIHSNYTCVNPDSAISNGITMHLYDNVERVEHKEIINLYPNPNKGLFNLVISDDYIGDMQLRVINTIGECVYSSQEYKGRKIFQTDISLPQLPVGVYYLHLTSSSLNATTSFSIFGH